VITIQPAIQLRTARSTRKCQITKGNGGEGGIDRPGLAQTLLPVEFFPRAALDSKT
jgi:hypothetical protein